MKKFLVLSRVQLRAALTGVRVGGSRKRAASGWIPLVFVAGMCLYVSGIYSFVLARQLAQAGALDLVLLLMSGVGAVVGMMFTAFATQGMLFSGRDADLLLSMPVPAMTVLLAKLTALYGENLVFCTFFMLPAGIARLWYGGGGVLFVLRLAVGIVFLALLPTVLALLVGFLLSWLGSRLGNRKSVSLFLYGLMFVGIFVLALRVNQAISALSAGTMGIQGDFGAAGWAFPFRLFQEGVCGNFRELGIFCLLALLPLLVAAGILSRSYQRVLTGIGTHRKQSVYRLTRLSRASGSRALLKKEAARYFGTPIYLFNTGIGLIGLVVMGIGAVVMRSKVEAYLSQLGPNVPRILLAAAAIGLFISTVAITGSSISLEGKNLWILKEAPVSPKAILRAKAGFQLLLIGPCLLVGVAGLILGLEISWLEGLTLLFVGAAFGCFTAFLGLAVNLQYPKLDAVNDTVVVKQSAASTISTFGSMGIAALCGFLVWKLTEWTGELAALILCAGLFLIGSLLLYGWLRTKGAQKFLEL